MKAIELEGKRSDLKLSKQINIAKTIARVREVLFLSAKDQVAAFQKKMRNEDEFMSRVLLPALQNEPASSKSDQQSPAHSQPNNHTNVVGGTVGGVRETTFCTKIH